LARAHRGFLYIDEVNLLPDHIVDLLLDVAASGENVVEREGLSVRHPAKFVLIGSGNPEEGELRPQLLDRFGLSLDVKTPDDMATRVEVVKRRVAFEHNPRRFCEAQAGEEAALRARLQAARGRLDRVVVSDGIVEQAAALCQALGTDGLRGELTLIRASRAAASLDGVTEVSSRHLQRVAALALRHRLRRSPLDDAGSTARVEKAVMQVFAA
jgi:magnesium chelatase subunit I